MFSTSGRCSVRRGGVQYIGEVFSTSRGYHEYTGGYHEYIGGYHDACGGIMSTLGDIMSTLGMFSTLGRDMMHVGEEVGKNLSISIENPNALNIPIYS